MSIQPIRKSVVPEIPDKLYFRIGDVARLCEVPAYVLRFWETEFPQLKPNKGGTGQRLYRKRDVEMALRIKSLLYDQGYTIPGARQVFKNEVKARETAAAEASLPVAAVEQVDALESSQPTPPAAAAAQPVDAGAEMRRQLKLRALRDEMLGVLALLSAPRPQASSALPTSPTLTPMRPRLVLEPRPTLARAEFRPETLRLVRDPGNQGDLFGVE